MNTMPVQQGNSEKRRNSEENQVVNKQLSTFIGTLNQMRDKMDFTDVTLTCGEESFRAHKVILCANSPYFLTMFSSELDEAKSGNVILRGIDPETLKIILSVIYFQSFPKIANTEQLRSLLAASHMLQFSSLFDYCCDEYVKKLDQSNFLDIWNIAELYENEEMLKLIPVELVKRFDMVKTTKDFLYLTVRQLHILVNALKNDGRCADDILKNILEWIKHSQTTRIQHLSELFYTVDLKCITTDYLSTLLESESLLTICDDVTAYVMGEAAGRLSDQTLRLDKTQVRFAVVCISSTSQFTGAYQRELIRSGLRYSQQCLIHYYDMEKMTLSTVIDLPLQCDKCSFIPVIVKNSLYCVATADPGSYADSRPSWIIEQGLKSDNSLKICCTLLENRVSPGVAALNDDIYVVGGTSSFGVKLRSVERYNVTDSKSYRISQTQKPHCTQAVVSSSNYIYVAEVKDSNIYIEQYDPKINQWHAVELNNIRQGNTGSIMRAQNVATCAGNLFFLFSNKLHVFEPKSRTYKKIECNRSFEGIWGMSNPKSEFPFIVVLTTDNELYQYQFSNKHFTKLPFFPTLRNRFYCSLCNI